ncbi:substrate-binding domain-containing protein [Anatilimnocola floriformis]|uniref:substrate-binding domain-containing protein n=1 Tax=Anatilimnocola floriformis TaxID=2948575 RepID=UPI0020C34825|nr:substrate-binding domain-containing protein [Anatilimnocola floriformis]
MNIVRGLSIALLLIGGSSLLSQEKPQVVRCAVIGGMNDTGLWQAVGERFEKATGHKVEMVARGPKREIVGSFIAGEADLITMHASDTIINLVADGYGVDPQPWAKNDLLLVGPPADPAGVRGEKDAVAALKKIVASKSKLLMHASLGANEVMADVLAAGEIEIDPANVISLPSDKHREMLKKAQDASAYTLVGRIPYLNAKIEKHEMQIMVQGDPRLRRPYVVVVANVADAKDPRHVAARQLASFLRSPETQAWLLEFGRGKYDDQPLFFPVKMRRP